jgi:hypothetical protein
LLRFTLNLFIAPADDGPALFVKASLAGHPQPSPLDE